MGISLKAQPMVAGWWVLACLMAACGDDGGSGGSGAGGGSGGSGGGATTSSSAGGGSPVCTPGEVEACEAYSGPEGTEGVGVCAASQRTCLPDGSGFGECSDEVLPSLENCATTEDDDCDGSAPACTLTHQWSRGVAGPGFEEIFDVAVDHDGNVVVVGISFGPIDMGGGVVGEVEAESRCFVAKYSPTGAHLWSHDYPGLGTAHCASIAIDATGGVYFTGYIDGSFDFGGGTLASIGFNVADIIVVKLDPNGAHVWSHRYGGSSADDRSSAITVDGQGRAVVAGRFSGFTEVSGQGLNSAGSADALVLALDADGGVRWVRGFGGVGLDLTTAVTTSTEGQIIVAGEFTGTVDFGLGDVVSQGSRDAFLVALDAGGEPLASLGFGGPSLDTVAAVELGPDGDVYLAGTVRLENVDVSTPWEFAGLAVTGLGAQDVLVARLDPSFTARWARLEGGGSQDHAAGLALDPVGNLAFAGFFKGTSTFGGATFTTSDDSFDVLLAKYDPSGAHLVSVAFGEGNGEEPRSVTVDQWGNVLAAGWYVAPFSFGGPELPEGGDDQGDGFIAKFSP